MKNPFIYLRALRHVEHTVFAIIGEQKTYYDTQFDRSVPYSSGQQVKRSMLEAFSTNLNTPHAPITFSWYLDYKNPKERKEKAVNKEGLAYMSCDPSFPDQLLGGYMLAESDTYPVKRRSPLSISAMRPIHPLLGGIVKENMTFDRSNTQSVSVKVFWREEGKGKLEEVGEEDLIEWLTTNKKNLPARKYIQDKTRASGLFVYDIAIDLRTLFCVSTNKLEPELFPEIEQKLLDAGWLRGKNIFGACLICPKAERERIIPAIAHALINWRITSNQSRTFSLMETLAIAISDNANQVAYAIRANLVDSSDLSKPKAEPQIDDTSAANLFITPSCSGYVRGSVGNAKALDEAANSLIEQMLAFNYENQV